MKKMFLVTMAYLFFANSLFADIVEIEQECEEDSLDVTSAIGRLEWALGCGHIDLRAYNNATFLYKISNGKIEVRERARPRYPSFFNLQTNEIWVAPVTKTAECHRDPEFKPVFCSI